MDDLLSEKEQIEKMRTWWSDYGLYVIGGVVLGAAILFGINYYQTQKVETEIAASVHYDEVAEHVVNGDLDAAEASAAKLDSEFGNSTYAAQSKLAMSRLYMDRNRDEDAAQALRELLETSGFENLKHIARVRLAKILLYQGKPEDVLSLLEGQANAAFAARYAEELGDAYVALGRYEEARASYQAALGEAQPTVDQGLIQLKLMDLPAAAAATPGEDDSE
ncbi:MAG: tetratricopeptide repeat protein [Gammaproteobacteria bacterium]|nr:tetratricopeptide repeat protein [Gammaproteobacteria bacterium]